MKRWICILLCLTVGATAHADELATGIKAWEQRDFATAQTIFTRLASAGNTEAQLLLGEMYGYGEGVPEDSGQAERLLGQAHAGGHKDAAESLANVRQRAARKDDIARYVAGAGASPPSLAQFGCVMPAFPQESRTQVEIKAVAAESAKWRNCYERYAAQLVQPAAKPPADLAKLMNLVELERAGRARAQAMAAAAAAANAEAAAFSRASDKWYAGTRQFAETMEKVTRDESSRRQREIEDITARAKLATELQRLGK